MIQRLLLQSIEDKLFKGKLIVLLGPRQAGKTTLIEAIQKKLNVKTLLLDCDEPDVRKNLGSATSSHLKKYIGDAELVMIDEAQRIENIGLTLKLFADKIKTAQVVATGSSSFELANKINEPLTGRKFEFLLFPVSVQEMLTHHGKTEETRLLEHRLIYGMYPEIVLSGGEEAILLRNITTSYLYKDIFTFQEIRRPEIIEKLLLALALQICSEVSYNELAQIAGADPDTIVRYITLLEQAFVIFRLSSFSRNVRNELKKSRKIYFIDNGIRNALIGNFNSVRLREDAGRLWENYVVSERMKYLAYSGRYPRRWFWRTRQQQEIDYIEEEINGKLFAYEIKWNPAGKYRFPKTFLDAYPGNEHFVVSPENYIEFLSAFRMGDRRTLPAQ